MLSHCWVGEAGKAMERTYIFYVAILRRFIAAACIVVVMFAIPSAALAATKVLKNINIKTSCNETQLTIDFGIPLRYVKHFPATSGEILQIQLLLEEDQGRNIHKEVKQGPDLAPSDGTEPLLIYLTYEEGVPGGPYLTLRFARRVSFELDAGDSLTQLNISILDDQATKKAAVVAKPTEEKQEEKPSDQPPVAAVVPPPSPAKPAVPEISMKTLEEQVFKQAQKSEQQLDGRPAGVTQAPVSDTQKESKPTPAESETAAASKKPAASKAAKTAAAKSKTGKNADELMAKARQALTFGDNDGAIQLLRRIIAMPENEHTQDARELVGLALERSNQIPRAKFEYKKYLKLYKEGEGTIRVRQRLQALQSVDTDRRKKLRKSQRRSVDTFTSFGRLSQAFTTRYQQREALNADDVVESEDIELTRRIDTFLSLRGRMRTEDRNVQLVFTGNNIFDILDSTESESRVVNFFLDYDAFKQGYYTILGRQRVRNSGVFSRFDGAIAGYDFLPWFRGHAYIGKPVELYDDRNIDKTFWGLKVDIGRRNDPVNMNLYMVNQEADGYADRQAVGYGVRYADRFTTVFGLLDYDFLFDDINLLNLRWGWKYLENSKLNVSYNFRKLIFLSSALNNQPLDTSLDTLVGILGEAEARRLAEDRTNSTKTFTIGNSYQFDRDNQLNVDLTMFQSSGTVTRNDLQEPDPCRTTVLPDPDNPTIPPCILVNVAGAPETGAQHTLSAQWISGNLFAQRDLYVFGTRLSKFDTYNDATLFVNARLPDMSRWKLRPRLTMSYRDFNESSSTTGTRSSIAPSIKIDYAWKKAWIFDFELGFEYVNYTDPDFSNETREAVRIGYSYAF
jgi:hypothetical protein